MTIIRVFFSALGGWQVYKNLFAAGLLLVLAACGSSALETSASTTQNARVKAAAVISNVAWNERVELAVPGTFAVTVKNGSAVLPVVSRTSGKVVFDLPSVPAVTAFTTASSVDLSTYNTVPTPAQLALYANRGTVNVQVFNANNTQVAAQDYQPFGSVESGELTVVGVPDSAGQCLSMPAGFVNVEGPLKYILPDQTVCLRTVSFADKGTQSALSSYATARPSQSVDRNTVSSLDPSGKGSLDPTCEQIEKWLNPISGANFFNINMSDYFGVTNAANRGSLNGSNIRVHIAGSGIGVNDLIACSAAVNFVDHDTHIQSLIAGIAPNVSFMEKKVCDDNGNCPASRVAKGLLEIALSASAAPNQRNDIVNLSLGSPLASSAVYRAILAMEGDVLVVASAGNHPFADNHFPAGYAVGLGNVSVPLTNVIAVAATGFDNGSVSWRVAGFNTRQNANIFAPGVNLCPNSVLSFRCNPSSTIPYGTKGATGSSFSTSAVVGVAALYLQQSGRSLTPTNLRTCLESKSTSNPNFTGSGTNNGMVWYDPAGC